jgi:uncharacterized protein DUF1549/uncharacterized protein DUF1553
VQAEFVFDIITGLSNAFGGEMKKPLGLLVWGGATVLVCSGMLVRGADEIQFSVEHADCPYFTAEPERFMDETVRERLMPHRSRLRLGELTAEVAGMVATPLPNPRAATTTSPAYYAPHTIDAYIFGALRDKQIVPAPKTTDWEFVRRVYLDLTGRIPTPQQTITFVADSTLNKRWVLIQELLQSPEWVDKWTMFYGDLFQNTVQKPSTGLVRYAQGRNAFYSYIKASLAVNKPYNQMATELISTAAPNSYDTGEINYLVGGVVSGGPAQDIMDQMTANTFDVFMGMAHVNCLLCHNGKGHLDALSLWGSRTTRYQAWQLSSFLSRTQAAATSVMVGTTNQVYWALRDNSPGYTHDYALNTTSGNRPSRTAPPGCVAGQACYYVAPTYLFTGNKPQSGETYRQALARNITGDLQFSRAAVNYLWAYFFGQGMVDPPDTFDPLRLDPNNPPPAPWTLQPTNPALLNDLAQQFVARGYDLKWLMSTITSSDAYQLSSRYDGTWDPSWQPYFARKYVRRLWAEEVHDAVVQSSGLLPSYTIPGFTDQGFNKPNYAMQLPDVVNMPPGDIGSNFLDSFIRGNRDDQPRKQDGSILQVLKLMNNPFIEARLQATGANAAPLIAKNLSLDNASLINTLFVNILSRYPTSVEMNLAAKQLSGSNRTAAVQDLAWSLYNKVDFIFNY